MTIDHTIPNVYVNFGEAPGPFLTLSVRSRYRPMPERNVAKSGPIASHWQLHVDGLWRRLYVSSKHPHNFVVVDRKRHHVVFAPPVTPTNARPARCSPECSATSEHCDRPHVSTTDGD